MADMDTSDQRTLWVGDIEQWMDETYVMNLFAHVAEVVNVKLIRDKTTMIPSGYGFVEFTSHATAVKILEAYNGTPIPNAGRSFRLNWATMGSAGTKPGTVTSVPSNPNEFAIYIGDLSADVTDTVLQNAFLQRYATVKNAKVVTDPATGVSKGYGFVRFVDENEKNRAMTEMQGQFIGARPIRISGATPKKAGATTSTTVSSISPIPIPTPLAPPTAISSPPPSTQAVDQNDPTNTTIFIGNLDVNIDEDMLRNTFAPFGELAYVKIPPTKGCGFVQYTHRQSAINAFSMNGTFIGAQRVRLTWGRNPLAQPATPTGASSSAYNPYYPYVYNPATGTYTYDYSSYYNYMVPQKTVDFTLPPDIPAENDEFISEGMVDQFSQPWLSKNYHGIGPDPDGPDPLIVSL